MALLRRRDHVDRVPRPGCGGAGRRLAILDRRRGTAEGVESLPVLFEGRRVNELDGHAVSAPQQLRAHGRVL